MVITNFDYIRYKYYDETRIGKVDYIKKDEVIDTDLIVLSDGYKLLAKEIIQLNHNIINLIREKDLLEIRYQTDDSNKYQAEIVQVFKNDDGDYYVNTLSNKMFIKDFYRYGVEILSVLTREQFAKQKYDAMEDYF